jgi:hypothetical protein
MSDSFLSLRKFSDRHSSWIEHLTKDILTTKRTKATKGSGFFGYKLRGLRGEIGFFLFGCGFAVLGCLW